LGEKRIKRIRIICCAFLCILCLAVGVRADDSIEYAEALNRIGLFRGTEKGYELDRTTTRAEAITLLVRVLGKEDEAMSKNFEHPFTDSVEWADPYLGYAYQNGIVKGISPTEFGPSNAIDHRQYATLLLRALGYSDDVGGQFRYNDAYEFACHKFAIDERGQLFTRGELVRLTYAALNTPLQGSSKTLAKKLISDRVFTQGDFNAAENKVEAKEQKTAILIYSVASDLESRLGMFSMDIGEILDAPTKDIEILVQAGGTKNFRNTSLADKKTQRFKITDSGIENVTVLDGVNMCDSKSLSDFLTFAAENVKADRYVLVMWDHGQGTEGGFGRDELNGNASLSLSDMKTALSAFGKKFDVIVFDACLMGTLETAWALRDAGEYLVASEDNIPTDGIYYTTWLNSLSADPKLSTEELARLIVDSYVVHAPQGREDVGMSVVRLSRVPLLADSVAKLFDKLVKGSGLERLLNTDIQPYGDNGGYDQYDLISIFSSLDMDVSDLGVALENTVYYKRSAVPDKYSGLAIYLPLKNGKFAPVKADLTEVGYPETVISLLDIINEKIKNGG